MNPILQFRGDRAITVGTASNRMPEILDGGGAWHGAHSLSAARRVASESPESVRVRCGARPLIEDILRESMPLDITREAVLLRLQTAIDHELTPEDTKRKALMLIKEVL